jgi:hypothetical protein
MGHWAETVIWTASGAPADEGELVNFGLINDGTYLYALIDSFMGTNPFLLKIDPVTHLEVSRFTLLSTGIGGPSVGGVYFDGTYLYVTYNGGAHHSLIQINPATMLEVTRWNDAIDISILGTITGDGTFIYVGASGPFGDGASLYKVDPTTMTHVSHWYGGAYLDNRGVQGNIIYSNGYVFTPTDMVHFFPNLTDWIRRIDVTTMTEFGFWGSANWGDRGAMVSDGTDLYFKGVVAPFPITKVDQDFMTTVLDSPSIIGSSCFPIIISGQLYFIATGANSYSIYSVDETTLAVTATETILLPGITPSISGVTNLGPTLIVGWTDTSGFPTSKTTIAEPVFVPSIPSSFNSGNIQHKLISEGLI